MTVKLTYWTSGDAEFALKNRWGITTRNVLGRSCWHPETRYKQNSDGTFTPPPGPEYVIVEIGNAIDVVEHKGMTDIFRMSNNETVIREANESIARGECRNAP